MQKSRIAIAIIAACLVTHTFASQTLGSHSRIFSKESPFDITDLLKKNHQTVQVRNPNTGALIYSQDGNFMLNKDWYMIQGNGNRLQAYSLEGKNAMGTLVDVKMSDAPMPPKATTTLLEVVNLNSGDALPEHVPFNPSDVRSYNYVIEQTIYDSLGTSHIFAAYFIKSEMPNTWNVEPMVDNEIIGAGKLMFDTTGKLLAAVDLNNLSYTPATGATSPQIINLNMTGSTGYAMRDYVRSTMQDGYGAGVLTGMVIDEEGFIGTAYSNGLLVNQYKIAFFNA